MKYTITGDNLQMVNAEIGSGELIQSVAGAMAYMTGNVTLEAKATGGAWASIKRSLTGASLFLVQYKSEGNGIVGLSHPAPGKIMDIDVGKGAWFVQKTGFLASEMSVNLELAMQKKLSSALFGGEGLIIQRISGTGIAFICGCGDFIVKDLAPGEIIKVSTAHAVAWQDTVGYDITSIGGVKNALFSGEGLFVTTLTGPGRVVLQSMTLNDLAMSLYPYMPQSSS
ncbi:MAG: TIGR00266 family protein [Thermoplasmata archaeon]|nr:TIGR00266 family protein [Thermoplasmata archaeon]